MTNKEIAQLIVGAHNVEFAERCIVEVTEALNEAEKRGAEQMRERVASHFSYAVEEMRKWVAAKYPDPTIHTHDYQRPRALISAQIRSIEEVRSLPLEGE